MTATFLQEDLCKEIANIFKHDRFRNSQKEEQVKLNVYEQNLPIMESDEDPDPVPYVIVRLETGTIKSDNDPQEVLAMFLIGYFDDSPVNNGHKGVLGIIQRIHERFNKDPMLNNLYMFQEPFEWALQDEESYPYFFGAAHLTFKTAAIRKEDKYA